MANGYDPVAFGNLLVAAGSGPAEASSDAGSMRQQPLKDLIALDQYLSVRASISQLNRGLYLSKIGPPGSTGVQTLTDNTPFP
jgi:hypothetical protein